MLVSNSFSLRKLIDFARRIPDVPHNKEETFFRFREIYEQVTMSVPRIPGWYVWIKVDGRVVLPIYVGRSCKGKTSDIRARLCEEFYDEYVAFWAACDDPKKVENTLCRKNLLIGYKEYRKEIQRSIDKRDTTDIAWVGMPAISLIENRLVEKYLIYKLQPLANKQGKKKPVEGNELCFEVLEEIRKTTGIVL